MAVTAGSLVGRLSGNTSSFDRTFKKADKTVLGLRSSFIKLGAAVAGALAARQLVRFGAEGLRQLEALAERGNKVAGVSRAFEKVTGNQVKAISRLRRETGGLIVDYELMVGFNRSLALGAANNITQFSRLAKTSIDLGRALGIDATEALEKFSVGIARQSKLRLDDLGIILNVEQANKDYARSISKTVEQLTEAEKKESFRNAALAEADRLVRSLGGSADTAADSWLRLVNTGKNFIDNVAVKLATNERLKNFLDQMTGALDGLTTAVLNGGPQMADAFSLLGDIAGNAFSVALSKAVKIGIDGLEDLASAIFRQIPIIGDALANQGGPGLGQRALQSSIDLGIENLSAALKALESFRPADGGSNFEIPDTGASDDGVSTKSARKTRNIFNLKLLDSLPRAFTGRSPFGLQAVAEAKGLGGKIGARDPVDLLFPTNGAVRLRIKQANMRFLEAAENAKMLGQNVAVNMASAVSAVVSGAQTIEQAMISMISNIVQNLPGVGGFAGALIGIGGGLLGGLFGRNREPTRVSIAKIEPAAESQLRPTRSTTQIFVGENLIGSGIAGRSFADLREFERRTGKRIFGGVNG